MELKPLVKKYPGSSTFFLFGCVFSSVAMLGTQFLFAFAIGLTENASLESFKQNAWVIVLGAVLISLLNFIRERSSINIIRNVKMELKSLGFRKIINKSYFNLKSKERYISNLINDVDLFEKDFFEALRSLISFAIQIVITMAILFFYEWKFAIALLAFSFLSAGIGKLFEKPVTNLKTVVSESNEDFSVSVSNTLNGVEILKLNAVEKKFCDNTIASVVAVEEKKFKYNFLLAIQEKLSAVMMGIGVIGILVYCMLMIFSGVSLTIVALVFQFGTVMLSVVEQFFPMVNRYKAASKIYDKITKENDDESLPKPDVNAEPDGKKPFNFSNRFKIQNLSYSYDNKTVLKNVSFEIIKGKKYLLRGASGAGKTTLLNILSKTLENYTGDIFVDDVNLKDISQSSFNEKIGFIFQNVFLFEDTIKNNIELYKEYSNEELNHAIKLAGLTDFINTIPQKTDSLLAENGKDLSGGQRQRISIARALIKNAEVLFVDEATASLQPELGKQIEQELLNLNSTLIAISHRYYEGVTENYDFIIELKNNSVEIIPTSYFVFTPIVDTTNDSDAANTSKGESND